MGGGDCPQPNALEGRRDGETTRFPLIPEAFVLPLKALAERSGAAYTVYAGHAIGVTMELVSGDSEGRCFLNIYYHIYTSCSKVRRVVAEPPSSQEPPWAWPWRLPV